MHSPKVLAKSRRSVRQRANRNALMMLLLENLESRVMMAGTATQLIFTVPPSQTAVGTPMFPAVQVTVADATGTTVTTDNSRVNMILVSNPVGGSLTQSGVVVLNATANAVNGVATFANVSFNMVGQYSIAVNDGSLLGVVSNTFNVTSAAAKLVFSQPPLDIGAGIPFSPAVTVFVEDANGNLVTTDRSAITLVVQSGPSGGALSGVTTINAVNGVATFSGVAVTKPGTYTLQAKEQTTPVTLTSVTSNSFVVSAGAPAKVVFQQQPVNTPQGTILAPIIIDVTDSGGNIVTTDNSAVTLRIATPPGSLLDGTTTVNAVNGVATFSDLSIGALGAYTFQASDGSLSTATSRTFAITGPGTKLAFQQAPVQTTAGQVMTPGIAVVVEDANGNMVTNDTSSVTIAITTGPGALSGTTTVPVVAGLATFNNLAFSQLGNYTVTVSDGALTPATSNTFLINGTASQMVFVTQPSQTAAGAPILPPVKIQIEDSAGNIVSNDPTVNDTLMTITVNTGPVGGVAGGTTSVPVVNGVALFSNLQMTMQGTYTLLASDGNLPGAISASFVVTPAPHLVFVTEPSNVAQNSVMYPSVVIQIENDAGSVALTNTTSVTLAIIDGPANGSISGTTTAAAVAGIATFSNLSFATQGQYTLVAYDGTLATDTSDSFTVTGPPAKLQWASQPVATVTAGSVVQAVTAWVEDRNGDVVNSDHSVVTLAISTGPTGGTIIGNATVNATNGVAIFNNVAFPLQGKYVLTVTDGTLTAAKSKAFNVVPDVSQSRVVVTQSPASTVVGRSFSSSVVVHVADQFGNVINNGSAITIAIQSGPGGTLSGSKTLNAKAGSATFGNLSINLAGNYILTVTDPSLNVLTPATFTTTISPVITSVTKPGTSNPYTVGRAFNLGAQLRGLVSSPIAWTGTANLVDANNNVLASTIVTSGGGVAFAVPGQTAGTYTLRVRYLGDLNHLGGSSTAINLVVGPGTTIGVTPSARSITSGTTLILNVLVSSGGTALVRTGTVQLVENGAVLSSLSLDPNSRAAFSFVPPAGNHAYTVQYLGDMNFRSSISSVVNITVT